MKRSTSIGNEPDPGVKISKGWNRVWAEGWREWEEEEEGRLPGGRWFKRDGQKKLLLFQTLKLIKSEKHGNVEMSAEERDSQDVLNKGSFAWNRGVNLLVLPTKVIFSETTVLNVLRCQSFPVKHGATLIFFYFSALWRSGSAVTDRMRWGRLEISWTATDKATELTGIICCMARMIITEGRLQ